MTSSRNRRLVGAAAALIALAAPSAAEATARGTWEKFVEAVSRRDEPAMVACYSSDLRDRLERDDLFRRRHVEELYALLFAEFGGRVINQKVVERTTVITVMFRSRKNAPSEFQQDIELVPEGGEWLISKLPRVPQPLSEFSLDPRRLTRKQLIGIGCALLAVFLIVKKLVTN